MVSLNLSADVSDTDYFLDLPSPTPDTMRFPSEPLCQHGYCHNGFHVYCCKPLHGGTVTQNIHAYLMTMTSALLTTIIPAFVLVVILYTIYVLIRDAFLTKLRGGSNVPRPPPPPVSDDGSTDVSLAGTPDLDAPVQQPPSHEENFIFVSSPPPYVEIAHCNSGCPPPYVDMTSQERKSREQANITECPPGYLDDYLHTIATSSGGYIGPCSSSADTADGERKVEQPPPYVNIPIEPCGENRAVITEANLDVNREPCVERRPAEPCVEPCPTRSTAAPGENADMMAEWEDNARSFLTTSQIECQPISTIVAPKSPPPPYRVKRQALAARATRSVSRQALSSPAEEQPSGQNTMIVTANPGAKPEDGCLLSGSTGNSRSRECVLQPALLDSRQQHTGLQIL